MSKPLIFKGKTVSELRSKIREMKIVVKKSNILVFAIGLIIFAAVISLWDSQITYYAHAYTAGFVGEKKVMSPLLESKEDLFDAKKKDISAPKSSDKQKEKNKESREDAKVVVKTANLQAASLFENKRENSDGLQKNKNLGALGLEIAKQKTDKDVVFEKFADKLYGIVGESPIKEMVPFIAQRDERVAAFLVGIAKKESSFGSRSPLKDGETCYNYWGYKGKGGRGTGMGYACFASAEEAIDVVGNRIEVLVNKQRNTPARMVDTWKCGTSCAGDPGAPGWTSTVALYFNQIVDQNG